MNKLLLVRAIGATLLLLTPLTHTGKRTYAETRERNPRPLTIESLYAEQERLSRSAQRHPEQAATINHAQRLERFEEARRLQDALANYHEPAAIALREQIEAEEAEERRLAILTFNNQMHQEYRVESPIRSNEEYNNSNLIPIQLFRRMIIDTPAQLI